jgi:hypothetical protein
MKSQVLAVFAALALGGALMAQTPGGRVRIVHASPDAPAVDIYVDGQIALEKIAYGDATDYVTVPQGQRLYEVYVNGTSTRVASLNATSVPGSDATVIATGFATPGKNPGLRLLTLQDNLNTLDGDARAYVRFVHASPSAPTVDIYAGAPFQTVQRRDPLLSAVPFGGASGYIALPGGSYAARLTPAGTKNIAVDTGKLSIPARAVITAIATDGGVLLLHDRN